MTHILEHLFKSHQLCLNNYKYSIYYSKKNTNVNMQSTIVVIIGNIGSGKSSQIEKLPDYICGKKIVKIPEPVFMWKNKNGINLLEKFYQDPHAYGMEFQKWVLKTHAFCLVNSILNADDDSIFIIESSTIASMKVFMPTMEECGFLSKYQVLLLEQMNKDLNVGMLDKAHCILLDSSPEYCMRNIINRNRNEEGAMSIDYLTKLDTFYKMIDSKKLSPGTIEDVNKRLVDYLKDLIKNQIV